MPPIETLLAFGLAAMVFGYVPGPAMLYATAQTIARGTKAGLMAALGLHVGGYVHVIAAAFGLAILFDLIPPLYIVLKVFGAGYLIWLGLQMIRTRHVAIEANPQTGADPKRAFRQSVLVEVLNPKTVLFYVAFLPQFSDPSAAFPIWAQLLILGTAVNVIFSSADLICIALAHRISAAVAHSQTAATRAKAFGGSVLMGLGVAVALDP